MLSCYLISIVITTTTNYYYYYYYYYTYCGFLGDGTVWSGREYYPLEEHFESTSNKERALISIMMMMMMMIITAIVSFWQCLSKTVSCFGDEDIFVLS